eukprot:1793872-Pleurochrysis_carterae.AAC.1
MGSRKGEGKTACGDERDPRGDNRGGGGGRVCLTGRASSLELSRWHLHNTCISSQVKTNASYEGEIESRLRVVRASSAAEKGARGQNADGVGQMHSE